MSWMSNTVIPCMVADLESISAKYFFPKSEDYFFDGINDWYLDGEDLLFMINLHWLSRIVSRVGSNRDYRTVRSIINILEYKETKQSIAYLRHVLRH